MEHSSFIIELYEAEISIFVFYSSVFKITQPCLEMSTGLYLIVAGQYISGELKICGPEYVT